MERILSGLVGKRIEVSCGRGMVFAGENEGVADGVLSIKDEHGKVFLIDLSKVIAVCESAESGSRPGFLGR